MKHIKTIQDFLNEEKKEYDLSLKSEWIVDLKKELSKYKTDEDFLRGGGITTETLDRLAFGFCEDDIKTLNPKDLKIKWKDDLENVKYEILKSGLTPKKLASEVDLSEPIEVSYLEDVKHKIGFYIEDGHHRYMAAKILNKPLNVDLEIKANPIKVISNELGYDELHRYIFKLYKDDKLMENNKNDNLILYHGTKAKFVDVIKKDGLIDKTGYNQGLYMLSTDFESALFHAHPDDDNGDVYVIEFEIPNDNNDRLDGYPYLLKGTKLKDNSTLYALMKQIPKEFIKKIHKVDYVTLYEQKNKGF